MKKFLICVSLVFAFLFGACSNTAVSAEQTNPLKIWYHNENGNYHTLCVVDEEPGVYYNAILAIVATIYIIYQVYQGFMIL